LISLYETNPNGSFGATPNPFSKITAGCQLKAYFGQNLPFPERKKAAYLNWHKLLFDDERESLPADAFEPVAYAPD
jgi:hypothetical protein